MLNGVITILDPSLKGDYEAPNVIGADGGDVLLVAQELAEVLHTRGGPLYSARASALGLGADTISCQCGDYDVTTLSDALTA